VAAVVVAPAFAVAGLLVAGSGFSRTVFVLVASGVSRTLSAQQVLDRVLAIVGGNMITLTDVTAARDFGLVDVPEGADPVREILPRLIDRELILAEVDRYAPPEPPPDALDREVLARRGRFGSEAAFQAALARSGINEGRLRETLRQDLRIRAYLDQRFAGSDRRDEVVIEWVAGLRRRTDIVDLSAPSR
jgi:hypothetical protein